MYYGGGMYPALEKGAKHYHYPGWWESNSMYPFYVNLRKWEKPPKEYQAAFEAAAAEANIDMMAEYDFKKTQGVTQPHRQMRATARVRTSHDDSRATGCV
jgi:TRAP-type mannitol/chloroaromatic compound transport system substrate-binding protein